MDVMNHDLGGARHVYFHESAVTRITTDLEPCIIAMLLEKL